MKRGDIVTAAAAGDYGKPRPALIIQDDAFSLASVTIIPLTSDLSDAPLFRLTVQPSDQNGLQKPSQAMVDKILTIPRMRIGKVIGELDDVTMQAVNRSVIKFLALEG